MKLGLMAAALCKTLTIDLDLMRRTEELVFDSASPGRRRA